MPDVIGVDHIYITVANMERSEIFYDVVMDILGFRKQLFQLDKQAHIQYYNRHFGYVLRPALSSIPYNPYSPGLHHLCLRVERQEDVNEVAKTLMERNITISEPKLYPAYAKDYYAFFLNDPDGLQLEITNYREERRKRHDHWHTK